MRLWREMHSLHHGVTILYMDAALFCSQKKGRSSWVKWSMSRDDLDV